MHLSHPSQAVRAMLEAKRLDCKLVNVIPLSQRAHLRLVGFRGGTVPALKLGRRRVQGSRQIARALDQVQALPALLDHVDGLIADGTLTLAPPNAATLQILASVRVLVAMHDLDACTSGRESARAGRELFPRYPDPFPARLPREWMPAETRG